MMNSCDGRYPRRTAKVCSVCCGRLKTNSAMGVFIEYLTPSRLHDEDERTMALDYG